jgi:hypothetical protein
MEKVQKPNNPDKEASPNYSADFAAMVCRYGILFNIQFVNDGSI